MKRRLFGAAVLAGLMSLTAEQAEARGRRSGGGGGSRGGCGSRGGAGYRKANGKCAGRNE